MGKDPNFVSVRLPEDVANWLREYAQANNLIRANSPNMGGSIIAVVRTMMQGQTISNNVRQSSAAPDVDIDSKINDAIASKHQAFESELENIKSTIDKVTKEFLHHRDIEIDDLKARVTDLEATVPANFTSALLQRAKEVAPIKLMEVA